MHQSMLAVFVSPDKDRRKLAAGDLPSMMQMFYFRREVSAYIR